MSQWQSVAVAAPEMSRDALFDQAALVEWVAATVGIAVRDVAVDRSVEAGFDSDIHVVRFDGDGLPDEWRSPLVLRVKSSPAALADATREQELHGWLGDNGYPVPRILAVVEPGVATPGPVQIMQLAPGVTMLDAVTRRPWAVGGLLDRFAALHNRLHLLALDGYPTGEDIVQRRLRLPRRVVAELDHAGVREGIDRMEVLSDRFHDAPASVCHGDFHPLNLLVDDASIAVIDWTDAVAGDRHCDIARTAALFDIAPIVASNPIERRVLGVVGPRLGASYLRRYRSGLDVDRERLALWTPLHALHDWSQALAGSTRASAMPADMAGVLQRRFERALDAVASASG